MRNGERDTSILIPIFIIIYNGVNSAGTICFDERYICRTGSWCRLGFLKTNINMSTFSRFKLICGFMVSFLSY